METTTNNTLNVNAVEAFDAATRAAIKSAHAIVKATTKEKLSDRDDKFIYIRAMRVIHFGLESLDRKSYDSPEQAMTKSKTLAAILASK